MREANNSLYMSVGASLKELEKSLEFLRLEKKFIDKFVEARKKIFYDVGFFDGFYDKNDIFKHYIIFNKRRRRELEGNT